MLIKVSFIEINTPHIGSLTAVDSPPLCAEIDIYYRAAILMTRYSLVYRSLGISSSQTGETKWQNKHKGDSEHLINFYCLPPHIPTLLHLISRGYKSHAHYLSSSVHQSKSNNCTSKWKLTQIHFTFEGSKNTTKAKIAKIVVRFAQRRHLETQIYTTNIFEAKWWFESHKKLWCCCANTEIKQ